MSIVKLKAHLAQKSQKELIKELVELYQKFSAVKDFYELQLNPLGQDDILGKHKKIILDEFLPRRGEAEARLSVARKSVMDFKKLAGINESLVDIAFYYVEVGVKYTNMYGDINEAFYNSMESMFLQALKWMKQLKLFLHFQQRADAICKATVNIGWGFHDELCESYYQFFDEEWNE